MRAWAVKDSADGTIFPEEISQDRLSVAERAKWAAQSLGRICTVVPVEIREITEEESS